MTRYRCLSGGMGSSEQNCGFLFWMFHFFTVLVGVFAGHDEDCPYSGLRVANINVSDGGDFQKPSRGIDALSLLNV